MSLFNGKITRRDKLRGELKQQPQDMQATVTPVDGLQGTLSPVGGVSGILRRAGKFFSGVVRPLDILYRFLASRRAVRTAKTAKPDTGPGMDLAAGSTIQADKSARLAGHPAEDLRIHKRERLGVLANFYGCIQHSLRYVKRMFLHRRTLLEAALGVLAVYRTPQTMRRTTEAQASPGELLDSGPQRIAHSFTAAGAAAPVLEVPATSEAVTSARTAQASQAGTAAATAKIRPSVGRGAALAAWFYPEQQGSTLHLFQVFSGVQNGTVLELDLEETSTYWANATVENGALRLVFAETVNQTGNTLEVV